MSDSRARQPPQEVVAEETLHNSDKEEDNGRSAKKAAELSSSSSSSWSRVHLLSWINRMINLCKDLAIMLLVVFTYAALMNEPPKTTKSPPAYPFFPHNSSVRDYYRGQISLATDYAKTADIAFVMFYAPWDAESQAVRKPFEAAAKLMENRVVFAAVNCWQPGGECRGQYSKVYKWPVLIAYAVHSRGVQYNGPYEAHHFVRFLNAVAKPFVRVTSSDELDDFIASYDATVVTYINPSPGRYDYAVLYTAALKLLEKDPFQEIALVVCAIGKEERPVVELHMWNESWVYPEEKEWLSDNIVGWIFTKLHQVTVWYHPPGMKSRQLSAYLQPGPALLLFSPKNPLLEHSDLYSLLREIGLEYYNCNNQWRVANTQIWLRKNRVANYLNYNEDLRKCKLITHKNSEQFPVVVTYSMKEWDNASKFAMEDFCGGNSYSITSDVCSKTSHCNCVNDEEVNCYKQQLTDDDLRSVFNLERLWQEEKCRLLKISQNYHPSIYSQSIIDNVNYGKDLTRFNITGLGCKTNASLTLIAVDSLMYYQFAERLGVNISKKKDKTFAVIVNEKQEMHHILHGPVTDSSLRHFIYNFTARNLNRALENPKLSRKSICTEDVCIKELNTENFLSVVMQQKKAVLVLYHSKQCFFCHGISHVLLTLSHILQNIGYLEFTRIDGDLNSLPWEYSMEKYPTILLFPQYKKSESRVFPRNMPITVGNLVNFILANMNTNYKIRIMYTLCEKTNFLDDREECTKDVRLEILDLIELNLKQWRKVNVLSKAAVLRSLKLLKRLHLVLGCSPRDSREIHYLLKRIENS